MQNFDKTPNASSIEMSCSPDCSPDGEQLVVFELVVPGAAKVPAPRQQLELARVVVRQASITSTVPGRIYTELRANNTALSAAWCITATLAAPQPACPAPRC